MGIDNLPDSTDQRLEDQSSPPDIVAPEDRPDCARRIPWTLEKLLNTAKAAPLFIKSTDEELAAPRPPMRYESKKPFLPAALQEVPEGLAIWEFMRHPSNDLDQIQARQDVLQSLKDWDNLENIRTEKTKAYSIESGVGILFSIIDINEYRQETVLRAFQQGDGVADEHVDAALYGIESGKVAAQNIIDALLKKDDPIFTPIVHGLIKALDRVGVIDRPFLKTASEDAIHRRTHDAIQVIRKLGILIESAKLIVQEEFTRVDFDETKPATYSKGWNYARSKHEQVPNDAPDDTPVTVYSGSNMSGKSYSGLKQNLFMQLAAQSLGFAPCQEGNFRMYDSFCYVDRASTDASHNLSAFGREITDWNEVFAKSGERPYWLIDEPFSTTSPEDQTKLVTALLLHGIHRGARTFVATHNERSIQHASENANCGVYHFTTGISEDGTVNYLYQLKEGAADSNAFAVAQSLGLSDTLLVNAARFREGKYGSEAVNQLQAATLLEHYSEDEREKLKREEQSALRLIFGNPKEQILRLYSEDSEFKQGMRIHTGEGGDWFTFGGWSQSPSADRASLLFSMLTQAPSLPTAELFERQRMFEALARDDQYEVIRAAGDQIMWILKFLPFTTLLAGKALLEFNKQINPLKDNQAETEKQIELALAYLRLNKKILGNRFPYDALYDRLKAAQDLLVRLDKALEEEAIDSVQVRQDQFQSREITDPDLRRQLLKLMKEHEQDSNQWGESLTLKRIFTWLAYCGEHEQRYYFSVEFNVRRLLSDRGLWMEPINAAKIKESYFALVTDESPEGEVSLARMHAYREKIQNCGTDGNYEALHVKLEMIGSLIHKLSQAKEQLPVPEAFTGECESYVRQAGVQDAQTISLHRLNEAIHCDLQHVRDSADMPPVPIFACKLAELRDEIAVIAAYYKKVNERSDLEYYHHWPSELTTVLVAEIFAAESDPFETLEKVLDGYDSVHLQQIRNNFRSAKESILLGYDQRVRRSIARSVDEEHGFTSVQGVLDTLRTTYEETISGAEEELQPLLDRSAALTALVGSYISEDTIIKLEAIVRGDTKSVWRNVATPDAAQGVLDELRSLGVESMDFVRRHKLKIDDEHTKYVEKFGGVYFVENKLRERYSSAVYKQLHFETHRPSYGDGRYSLSPGERVRREVRGIQTLALFGHMINEQQLSPIEVAPDSAFEAKGMFSVTRDPASQVKNDITLNDTERIRLITGPNMSGKTFYLKGVTFAALCGLATGYAPVESMRLPMVKRVVYLDRVNSKQDNTLSAFGNEAKFWKEFFDQLEDGTLVIASVDEAWSTTSPQYQAALTYATAMEVLRKNCHLILASHNHEVLTALEATHPDQVKAHHLAFTLDDEQGVTFQYQMQPGHALSNAILVAQRLGLPKEIIDLAELIN